MPPLLYTMDSIAQRRRISFYDFIICGKLSLTTAGAYRRTAATAAVGIMAAAVAETGKQQNPDQAVAGVPIIVQQEQQDNDPPNAISAAEIVHATHRESSSKCFFANGFAPPDTVYYAAGKKLVLVRLRP